MTSNYLKDLTVAICNYFCQCLHD